MSNSRPTSPSKKTPTTPTSISGKDSKDNTCIVVLGASGDLAYKKTYPALFGLFKNEFLPPSVQIVGYARSKYELADFKKKISSKIKLGEGEQVILEKFLSICTYVSGKYDEGASFQELTKHIEKVEKPNLKRNRVFYMALPPSVFIPASQNLKQHCYSKTGENRLVVEKPFGKDFDSSRELSKALAEHWNEDEIYRIDHYLGKEMVKSLMTLRFANVFFGGIWNRNFIQNVQITFKEKIGTEGRGGYFDEFGIIRDVMQNHLLQILTIVGMARPASLDSEDIRNEKVKVLKSISPLKLQDVIIGQYSKSADKSQPGYLDDPGVPKDSVTPTFCAAVFEIKSERWDGVSFILKCGKALNESKAEIRIQFQDVPGCLYGENIPRNELVVRVQPDECVYLKLLNKEPGLSNRTIVTELDLTYKDRYESHRIPDAYESLILDVLKGDKSNFVRDDELDAAWKIFTPLLHELEREKVKPEIYQFGDRGPASLNSFIASHGFKRWDGYEYVKKGTKL